jgi:hypothetical protein
MVQVLGQCGDDLTRENVMRQAAVPGISLARCCCPASTWVLSLNDFFPIEQMQLMRFNGESWELFGEIISGEVGH